jgi:CHAT domain-containing protein
MMHPIRRLVIAAVALVLAAAGAAGRQSTTPPRELSKVDEDWVVKKHEEAVALGRVGKWGHDEAEAPVREILALCTRVLGENHWLTVNYRLEIESLKKLITLPEASRAEYVKAYALLDTISELRNHDRYADAVKPAEQFLDIHRRTLGPDSTYTALASGEYGKILYHVERYTESETHLRQALTTYQKVVGEDFPTVAEIYGYLGLCLEKLGRFRESRANHERALKIMTRVRGETHPWTAVIGNNLATHLERQGLLVEAEHIHRRSMETLRAAGPDKATLLATQCNNLALNLNHQARYAEAEALFLEALAIRRRLSGEDHSSTGRVYMNFASNREAQGYIAAAEALYLKALINYRKGYGNDSFETAWAINNLAVNLDKQGKYAEAEPLLREALAIARRAPGEQGWAVARISSNLASCLRGQDKLPDAEALCREALSLLRDRLGPDHPHLAVVLNNLASTLKDQEKYAEAERHFREALAIMIRRLGDDHPDTAQGRANLAINCYYQGKFDEADRLCREALASYRKVLGESHPETAWAYKNLIGNDCARGDYAGTEALAAAATTTFEAARVRLGFAGLDRVRRAADVSPLPGLAVAAARRGNPLAAWQALEGNLARGLLDELSARRLSDEDRQHELALLETLDRLDRRVEALRHGDATSAADRRKAESERDGALSELVRFQAALAEKGDVAAGRVYDFAQIQKRLPAEAALLAWVDLPAVPRWADPKGDHWACLIRSQGDPVWVQLPGSGSDHAWTDDDERLASRVRNAFATRPNDPISEWHNLAAKLAAQRITPLESKLKAVVGRPGVQYLIVLPSHMMAGIPVEALPGVADRYRVSYAPSGTMFGWLRERSAEGGPRGASLLALGDPAFRPARNDGAEAVAPSSGARREAFAPLPATNAELLGVARVFPTKRLLTGSEASEQDLDELAASGRLREYRYLHFATHGILDGQRPMRSALILAQDRLPDFAAAATEGKVPYDGRLTAERILRRWKLDANLVTLSACDTGLGHFSGGEGYLGFSQALFLAGARSLVLSLWEVDDASTSLLMTRFYENLAGDNATKPMPKAEALAEAKRWLRELGPGEVDQLTKDLPTRGTRGRVVPLNTGGSANTVRSYEHPYYWSGFILIGDPW